jgi:hypothetical protein
METTTNAEFRMSSSSQVLSNHRAKNDPIPFPIPTVEASHPARVPSTIDSEPIAGATAGRPEARQRTAAAAG